MMSMNWNYPTSIWFGEKRIDEIQKKEVKCRLEAEQLKKTISVLRKKIEELTSGKRKK